ncbi:MAG TPA: M48 family metallopeptidase [Terriglobales bacterium]|nr:M48 family metallopeptidase [Terriglobales bacterium]
MSEAAANPRAYAREKLLLGLTSGVIDLLLLIWLLTSGASRELAAWLDGGPARAVLLYVVVVGIGFKLVGLPFGWWGRRIEVRFGMNRQGLGSWWWDLAKATLLEGLLAVAAGAGMYWLLRAAPQRWWLWAWAVFTLFMVVMAQLGPVLLLPLFFKMRPLAEGEDAEGALVKRLLATYAGLRAQNPKLPRLHGIFEWKLGEKSAKANAALTGLGRTRRVIISDTLLEASPPEEIEAVFIHELGHHVHGDLWRGLGFQSGLFFVGFWLAQWALTAFSGRLGLHGVADVAGLPLVVLVFALLGLLLLPASNGFVRAMERRADDYSFETLGTAEPLIAGLQRLADKNLAEIEPPRWKEWLLYSHPSIATRIRRGRAWQASHGTALGRG